MKKTTKKLTVACLALLSCAAIGVAAGCDASYMDAMGNHINGVIDKVTHVHDYTELKSAANGHWYECVCGAKSEEGVEAHKGGTATCTEEAECTVCHAEYENALGHKYTLKADANGHWYECDVCDYATEKKAHEGGEATCTEKAVCTVCELAYGEANGHTDTLLSDENYHWYECDNCDYATEKEAHKGGTATTTEKAECEVCGKEYGEIIVEYTLTIAGYDPTADRWNPDDAERYYYTVTGVKDTKVNIADPSAVGYKFLGYVAYDEDDNEVPVTLPETFTESTTLFATWAVTDYNTVTMEFVDGRTEDVYFSKYVLDSFSAYTTTEDGKYVSPLAEMSNMISNWTDWNEEVPATFEAKDYTFTEKAYKLTIVGYDPTAGGRSAYITEYGKYGYPMVDDPSAEGYAFQGYVDIDENEATIPFMIMEDVTVFATWAIADYGTVTMNFADGVTEVYYFSKYAPDMPSQYAVTADGAEVISIATMSWILTSAEWVEEVPATLDMKDYTFNEKTYTLTIAGYDPTADVNVEADKYNYTVTGIKGAQVSVADPTAAGYTFKGYTVNGKEVTLPETLTENVKVVANWTINPYTLTVVDLNGKATEYTFGANYAYGIALTVNDLADVLAANLPASDESTMFVWNEEVPETFECKNYTFTMKETRTEYDFTIINYDPLAGIRGSTYWTMLAWGTEIELADPQSFTGATFSHYEDLDGNVVTIPSEMPKSPFTAYAIWDVTPYTIKVNYPVDYTGEKMETITFGAIQDVQNGIYATVDSMTYAVQGLLPEMDEYYTYAWAEEIPEIGLQNYEFTINATKVEYTYKVIIDLQNGIVEEITAAWGTELTIDTPTAEGKELLGWIDVNGNEVELATEMPVGDVTVYANWKTFTYTLTFNTLAGTETWVFGIDYSNFEIQIALNDLNNDKDYIVPELPDDTAEYTYAWDTEIPETFELKNYTFTVEATKVEYTYYVRNYNPTANEFLGENPTLEIKAAWGEAITVETPTYEGLTFLGWTDVNSEAATLPETMPIGGGAIYATWAVADYNTVTMNFADGTTEVYYFSQYVPSMPMKDFNTEDGNRVESVDFMSWFVADGAEAEWVEEVPDMLAAQDYTFTQKTYTLTIGAYDPNANRNENPEKYYYTVTGIKGTPVNVTAPTAEGYTFAGYTDVESNEVALPATLTEDVMVFVNWTVDEYTLTIVNVDGTSTEYKFGVIADPNNGIAMSINNLAYVLTTDLPADTEDYDYAWNTAIPETFELKDYTFTVKVTYLTPKAIVDAAYALANDESLNQKYTLTGVIINVNSAYSAQYQNVTVTMVVGDMKDKPIQCFRMIGTGADVIAVGYEITVTGTLKNYSGTIEFEAGCTLDSYVEGEASYESLTISEALAAADGTNVEVTGTVVKIGTAYDSYYNNISVYIADDNGVQLYLYRLTGEVEVGQIITVKGTMATYSGARQVAQGSTFEAVGTHTCANYTEATCKEPATCVVCGVAKDDVFAGHDYVEGVCRVCNSVDPDYEGDVVVTIEATLSFASTTNRESQTTSQQIWKQNKIIFTNDKAASTSNVANYSNPVRCYASSSINVKYEGKSLTKIAFTCNSASYATALKNSIGTMEGVTVAVSGQVVTVTFAKPVESFTVTKLTAQVRINSLTVWAE